MVADQRCDWSSLARTPRSSVSYVGLHGHRHDRAASTPRSPTQRPIATLALDRPRRLAPTEILADETSQRVMAGLSHGVGALYADLP